MTLDVAAIRADFPIFEREINGFPLVYLDSGNTSQKPRQVIETVREHYERHNANVARSVHTLGTEATLAYEGARAKVAGFIGASTEEVVFTGDALFQGSIGRTDFPGGSLETLLDGIREKLLVLPDETRVLAGHMGPTTIGRERRTNPFLQADGPGGSTR